MRIIIATTAIMFGATGAFAAMPEGQSLSEIVAKIEQTANFQYVDQIDWDNDGYYEIEYRLKDGSKVEIHIDPKTGNAVR